MEDELDEELKWSESQIEGKIQALLWDVLVRGQSANFGLSWRMGSTEFYTTILGSWMNKLPSSDLKVKSKTKQQISFFVVDDDEKLLIRNKSDTEFERVEVLNFKDINYVHLFVQGVPSRAQSVEKGHTKGRKPGKKGRGRGKDRKGSEKYSVRFVIETDEVEWTLSPVQNDDAEVVVNWVACLRHRAQIYSDELLLAHNKALKLVVTLQSHYRRRKARTKFLRRKKRREGIANVLASTVTALLYGGDGYYDTDSEDEENQVGEGDNVRRVKKRANTTTSLLSFAPSLTGDSEGGVFMSVVSAVMNDFYAQAFGAKGGKPSQNDPHIKRSGSVSNSVSNISRTSRHSNHSFSIVNAKSRSSVVSLGNSSYQSLNIHPQKATRTNSRLIQTSGVGRLQSKHMVRPVDMDEIEDEAWEYRRWELSSQQWSAPTYGDRIYRSKSRKQVLEDCIDYDILEWEPTQDWQKDLSGLNNRSCGKDGWVYGSSVRNLIVGRIFGRVHISPSPSHIYKRRRWFQRRKRRKLDANTSVVEKGNHKAPGSVAESRMIEILDLYDQSELFGSEGGPMNSIAWHGWLGIKSETTGRWNAHYFALTSGLRRATKVTGISLVQFRHHVLNHADYISSNTMSSWEELETGRDIRIYSLEAGQIFIGNEARKKPAPIRNGRMSVTQGTKDRKGPKYGIVLKLAGLKSRTIYLACESRQSRHDWSNWMQYLIKEQDTNFTLTKIQVQNHRLIKNATFDQIPAFKWSVLDRLVPCTVDDFVRLAYFDTKFRTSLHRKLQTKDYREVQSWSHKLEIGSRRELSYILPKQRSKIDLSSAIPRTNVIEKFRIESYEATVGFHMISSLTFDNIPFGTLFQCLVRTVVSKWKENRARICVSMELDVKSGDENVYEYLESLMRAFMFQFYVENWIPLLSKAIKFELENKRKEDASMKVVTPLGTEYKKVK